jgi:predicted GIY-YIG superfamily endonuclease
MRNLGDTILVTDFEKLEYLNHGKNKGSECVYFLYKKPKDYSAEFRGDLGDYLRNILESTRADELVYVGVSRDYQKRILKHRKDKDFDYAVVMFIGDRENSMSLEQFFIKQINPKYNKHSNGKEPIKSNDELKQENKKLKDEIKKIKKSLYSLSTSIRV